MISAAENLPATDDPAPAHCQRRSIGWLAVLSVATVGLYWIRWAYCAAREEPTRDRTRWDATVWGIGMLAAPIGMCILYRVARRLEIPPWRAALPALGYGALALLLTFYGEDVYAVAGVLLAPPGLLVQHWVNERATESASDPVWLRALLVGLGLPVAVAVFVFNDQSHVVAVFGRSLDAGEVVVIGDSPVALTTPGSGWQRIAPGFRGEADSALELSGPGNELWLVAYVVQDGGSGVETTVRNRYAIIDDSYEIVDFSERRFFIDQARLITASVSSYRVRQLPWSNSSLQVLTVALDDSIVEVVAHAHDGKLDEDEARGWMAGAHLVAAGSNP